MQTQLLSHQFPKLRITTLMLMSIVVLSASAIFVTPYMLAATLAYLLMISGLALRHYVKLHATLMITGILLDLIVVLALELSRSAIDTAMSFSLSPLQQAHIGTSSIALLLYFPVLTIGVLRLKGKSIQALPWHIRLGITAFVFRTLGFLLMFSMLTTSAH